MAIPAPAIPEWLLLERETAMQVDDQLLDCTVFLGRPLDHGFAAEGTGFFLHVPSEGMSFLYIVTCRHVVQPTKSLRDPAPNDEPIWIRINREGDAPPQVIETKRSEWVFHADKRIDVCLYPFDRLKHNPDEDLAMTTLNAGQDAGLVFTEEHQKRWGLALGDEVFIAGCFVGRVGDRKNIPVIRLGSIAAKPGESMWGASHQHPAYLIETRSLGGVSGSPVFLHTAPDKRLPTPQLIPTADGKGHIAPYFLIGMMQGFHSGQYAGDFIGEDDEQKIVPVDTDFNAGIGVAIPIKQIMGLVDRADLTESRMATIKAKKKLAGVHDASASVPKIFPPSNDVNPTHREDFTRLVGAAARKQEPEG